MPKPSKIEYPALYVDADELSKRAQSSFFLCLRLNLIALLCSSLFLAVFDPSKPRTAAVLVCLLSSLASIAYLAMKRPQQTWYQARALSESVKTISWRYMMQSEPYDIDETDSKKLLVNTMKKLLDDNHGLTLVGKPSSLIPDAMYAIRTLSLKDRQKIYIDARITNQKNWYSHKANWNSKWGKRWFWTIVAMHGAALLLIVGQLSDLEFGNASVDVFLTASASMVGWVQAKRFEDLATSYGIASHEIGLIGALASQKMSSEEFSHFVGDAENAFSREHTQWRARRDG